jgi:16S rRNA A1518/A1519 N6-dimethyltransferase RsmA/KsgA/DIM1 with predicted DNA glycosylase/AP lyase activity
MGAKYAQHFLINQHAAKRIVDSLKLEESDSVLEIGPGKGVLTAQLLKAKHVVVVDIDSQMTSILSQRLTSPALQIFNEDILKFDFSKLKSLGAVKVIGNLPYNLTSPILRRLADRAG